MLVGWGGNVPRALQKVIAAYRRVYGFSHLWADCRGPGSAPELYAHFEYDTTFTNIITTQDAGLSTDA